MDSNDQVAAQEELETATTDVETLEADTEEVKDTTDWKAKFEEADGRRKRAEKQLEKSKIEKKVEEQVQKKTGGLDENALDYLDLKGISEDEDIKIIESIVKKTGMTVREALKDEYVTTKLAANKQAREVSAATPSSTKRSGQGNVNDVQAAIAKYEQSGFDPSTLPTDFELRSKVVNAIVERASTNKPRWQK